MLGRHVCGRVREQVAAALWACWLAVGAVGAGGAAAGAGAAAEEEERPAGLDRGYKGVRPRASRIARLLASRCWLRTSLRCIFFSHLVAQEAAGLARRVDNHGPLLAHEHHGFDHLEPPKQREPQSKNAAMLERCQKRRFYSAIQ